MNMRRPTRAVERAETALSHGVAAHRQTQFAVARRVVDLTGSCRE